MRIQPTIAENCGPIRGVVPKSILVAAHTALGGPFVVGSHHLKREFEALGIQTGHMAFPSNAFNCALRSHQGPRRLRRWIDTTFLGASDGGEIPLFSFLPWASVKFTRGHQRSCPNPLLTTFPPVASALSRRGLMNPDLLIVDHPRWAGLERIVTPRKLIYRPTDLYIATDPALLPYEAHLASRADGLVATSTRLTEHLRNLTPGARNKPAIVLENGVEFAHFATPSSKAPELFDIPGPKAIYVGALDDRFDFQTVKVLATERPDWSIILLGPMPEHTREPMPPNVHFLGAIPYRRLPEFLQHCDVGLLPTNGHPLNDSRSPMKLYEYAAAGLPVVARRTSELSRRNEPFVFCYDETDASSRCLVSAAKWKTKNLSITTSAAEKRDWRRLAKEFLAFATNIIEQSPSPRCSKSERGANGR